MQLVDRYLKEVESSLRCPAERQPTVIEELRCHLTDRVETLLSQGLDVAAAERKAVREMGPVWLMAFRLSAANGWNKLGHLMQFFWSVSIGVLVASGGGATIRQIHGSVVWVGRSPHVLPLSFAIVSCLIALISICCVGFGMGRNNRSWSWAGVATLGLAWFVWSTTYFMERLEPTLAMLAGGAVLSLMAAFGQKRAQPRLSLLVWIGIGLLFSLVVINPAFHAMKTSPQSTNTLLAAWFALAGSLGGLFGDLFDWKSAVHGHNFIQITLLLGLGSWLISKASKKRKALIAN